MNKKKMTLFDLISASVGMTIGAGVVTTIGNAVAATGRSTWIAYGAAIILGFLSCVPFALQARLVYTPGGFYPLVSDLISQPLGAFSSLGYIPSTMQLSLYSAGVGTYLASFIPGLNKNIVATIITIIFLVLNLAKLDVFKKVQNVMFVILLAVLTLFIFFGFSKLAYSPLDFSSSNEFMTGGSSGFFGAVMILLYSTNTYKAMTSYGSIAENPKRDIPLSILITPLVLVFFYCGIAIVDTCVLPIEATAGQSLVVAAKTILPGPLFIIFIFGGCIMALLTTINSALQSYSQKFARVAEDGWLPGPFAKLNKNGQPTWMLTLIMVISLVVIWSGMSLNAIVNNVVLIQFTCQLLPIICNYILPVKHPECWESSNIKMSKGMYYFLNTIGLVATLIAIVGSAASITPAAVIISIAALAVILGYCFWRYKSGVTTDRKVTW